MRERWGDSKRDRDALDQHLTREQPPCPCAGNLAGGDRSQGCGPDCRAFDEITAGMLQWEPGTLSTRVMDRVLTDVLADTWQDVYRRGEAHAIRVARFRERIARARYAATGEDELR